MMSLDAIACLVASLALISLAIGHQQAQSSGAAALYDYQLANDAAEVLYKSGGLREFAVHSQGDSNQSSYGRAMEQLQQIQSITRKCIMLSNPETKAELSTCAPSSPKARVIRIVPYSGGISTVALTMGNSALPGQLNLNPRDGEETHG